MPFFSIMYARIMNRKKILKRVRNIALWTSGIGLVITAILLLLGHIFLQFRMSDAELTAYFERNHVRASIHYVDYDPYKVRYVSVGDTSLPVLLLIHGAPSSLSVAKDYMIDSTLLSRYHIIAFDRPGYGYSRFGRSLISIGEHAAVAAKILEDAPVVHPVVVSGTSYGGPIAARLSMDYPSLVDGLMLISPAVAPGKEKILRISYPMDWLVFKWAVPDLLRVANDEKLHHRKELEQMSGKWKDIHIPVIHLHGDEDWLVYPETVVFLKESLINAPLESILLEKQGHLISFQQKPLVINKTLEILDKLLVTHIPDSLRITVSR